MSEFNTSDISFKYCDFKIMCYRHTSTTISWRLKFISARGNNGTTSNIWCFKERVLAISALALFGKEGVGENEYFYTTISLLTLC